MAKYTSGRQRNLKVGLSSYSENTTSLEVIGKVGIGTTNATSSLYVVGDEYVTGVVTATTFYGTFSGNSSTATYATNAGIATYATSSGIATYAPNAGIATYATSAGISTYATNAGIATYATNAGIATYATSAGIATYATNAGIATYATNAGIATNVIGGIASVTQLYVSSGISTLGFVTASNVYVSGVVTATTFNGQVNAGVGTITNLFNTNINSSGIITASTLVSNVAQGTSPITVGSSTLVTNLNADYLDGNDSTYYTNASNLVSGTVAAARLQNSNSFNVLGDLNVTGNITIGGTSAFVVVDELIVKDKDLILGFTTNASNQDASTDNTANHGGIAIASTEGSYLVPLQKVGLNTLPETYKQFMWVKNGTYGVGTTDAWISNQAIGIGSTQVPNGVRLAVGGVWVTDTTVTATTFSGNASSATYATNAGIATNVIGGIASVTQLNVSGISTLGVTSTTNLTSQQLNVSGVSTLGVTSTTNLTSQLINVSGITTSGGINVTTGNDYKINATSVLTSTTLGSGVVNSSLTSVGTLGQLNVTGVSTLGVTSTTNLTSQQLNVSGITTLGITSTTNLTSQLINVSGITTSGGINVTTGNDYKINATSVLNNNTLGSGVVNSSLTSVGTLGQLNVTGVSTLGVTSTTNLTSQQLQVSGISTLGVTSTTNLTSQQLNVSGVSTLGATSATNLTSQQLNVSGVSTLGVTSATNLTSQQLNVSGFSTVGVLTATSIGIGTTNPTVELWVGGSGYFIGSVSSANGFYVNGVLVGSSISGTNIVGTALSIAGISTLGTVQISSGIITSINSGVVTYYGDGRYLQNVVGFAVSLQSPVSDPVYPMFANNSGVTTAGISTTQLVFIPSSGNLGLGSTNPGSKLAVIGDVYVSGVVTATAFKGNANTATYATNAGTSTSVIGGIASVTQLNVSGISTLGITSTTNLTSQQLNVSGISTLGVTSATNLTSQQLNVSGISTLGITSTTNLTSQQLNVSGISTLGVTSTTNLTSQQLNVSGVSTFAGITTVTGETLFAKQLNVSGVVTATTFYGSAAGLTGIPATRGIVDLTNITTGTLYYPTFVSDAAANSVSSGIGTTTGFNVTSTKLSFNPSSGSLTASGGFVGAALSISGITTTSTLNVGTGGTVITTTGIGSVGIGTTNPKGTLQVGTGITMYGSTGIITAQYYYGDGSNLTGTVPNTIVDINVNKIYYPLLSQSNSGTISSVSVSSNSIVFNPGLNNLGIGTTNALYTLTVTSTSATATTGLTDVIADFTANTNSYSQINTRNTNNGTSASTDIIATADNGNNTTNYIDLGINNSGFSAPGSWTINGPLDGYLYTSDTNLSIGAAGVNKYVSLFAGGTLAVNEKLRATSTGVGIGSTIPAYPLDVRGNARVSGAFYDSTNQPGTANQALLSTITGTQWSPIPTPSNIPGLKIFDTSIDNTLYVQPTGTLDRVGVGTTVTQITTFPSGSNRYVIHSIHVTNISNGDAEITGGFLLNSQAVPASISVGLGQSGRAGVNTVTVGSASTILVGMSVNGTGNIGETTGIGSTAGFQYNTYVTSVDANVISLSKPMSGRAVGVATFTPVSKFASRLPVPVGSAVELLKQPMILNALDSIVLQSTGVGFNTVGLASTSTAAISQTSGSNLLTVTAGAAITNFISAGQLIQGTGSNTGIQTNTFVGVGYTPGTLSVPMTRPATSTLASQVLSFSEVITPQDGALQATIVYQSSTDTSYLNGTGTVAISSNTTSVTAGLSSIPVAYYATGNTYGSTIQSIRVTNISDGLVYPGGDYSVSVGIGNSDTIFSWLAYNMMIPKNSSIELCEGPKRLGIGQSIFAVANTPYTIEIQVAGKQKTS